MTPVDLPLEELFWRWFAENEGELFRAGPGKESLFDEVSGMLSTVHPDLTFEFGPVLEDGTREFVISAGGIGDAFPNVERLHDAAPSLKRWKFVKFRPRRDPMTIKLADRELAPEDVHFRLYRDGDKIGIVLIFEGYTSENRPSFAQFGYLFLDNALGEYIVVTEIGFIDFADRSFEQFDPELDMNVLWPAFADATGRSDQQVIH